jgi:hypothetical protein
VHAQASSLFGSGQIQARITIGHGLPDGAKWMILRYPMLQRNVTDRPQLLVILSTHKAETIKNVSKLLCHSVFNKFLERI